jgi:lipoate-protein ligase A
MVPLSPQEHLDFDDALLDRQEEAFRLWESATPFVVLGRSCKSEEDVEEEACARLGVPILRRSSGGGTVLQGPGCLNFTCILSLEKRPELMHVQRSYQVILKGLIDAFGLELRCSDLLLNGRKVSGNAQRRTRGWLLHHGTLLYEDMPLIAQLLKEPPRQPGHRKRRTHAEFLTHLPFTREALITALRSASIL